MTDGVNVDFGLLKQPDYTGEYANAFQMGRQLAQPSTVRPLSGPGSGNAMRGAIANPQALPPARVPPPTAAPPGPAAPEAMAQDPDLQARLANLDPPARAQAAGQAELLASLAQGLRGQPYAERGRILTHLAPALAARGVPPGALSGFDPTDAALEAAAAQALALHGMLTT
ncbi:MAG: hypothetical protein KGL69_08875 [Alphaproteobacteria bacterium]|nr:hypothetical protein [Alphaproteobacteria bacterium]